jgi:pilus assembly protein CpaE
VSDGKITVVAVDDEPLTLTIIEQALKNHPRIKLVGTGVNGREALQLANRLRPDVMVLDINMPVFNGLEAAARITAAFPSVGILMLTAEVDGEVVKAALRAGVKEYLSKTTEIVRIADAILRVSEQRDRNAPDKGLAFTWSFYGVKGTSGTSTVAVNAACLLASMHYKVLLLDLDLLQGDCAFMLGMSPLPPARNLLSQLAEMTEMDAAFIERHVRRFRTGPGKDAPVLDVLDSPGTFVPQDDRAEANLATLVDFLSASYDYIVADLPPSRLFDRTVAPLLDLSERVFVTANRDLPSLKGVLTLTKVLAETSFSMSKLSLLFAPLVDQPDLDHLEFVRERVLGVAGLHDVPLDRAHAPSALRKGKPVVLSHPDAPLAAFVRALVEGALNLPPTRERKGNPWSAMLTNFRKLLVGS